MYDHQLQPVINWDRISLIRLFIEHFQRAKVKFCLSDSIELMSVCLFWECLRIQKKFPYKNSYSSFETKLEVKCERYLRFDREHNSIEVFFFNFPQSCLFWDYNTSKSLTLFSASEMVYVLPLRSNIIPSNDSSLSYSFWISLNRF